MQSDIALQEDARQVTTDLLNVILSSLQVFYVKLQHFHWNVTGPNFFELHEKLEEAYDQLFGQIDEVAERIRMMGKVPHHTMQDFLDNSEINEQPEINSSSEMVAEVVSDYNGLITLLRNSIEQIESAVDGYTDEGTIDELVGYIKSYEKQAWMFGAYLN